MNTRRAERGFFAKTMLLAGKDLRVELRGRDTLMPALGFVLAVLLLVSFSLSGSTGPLEPKALPPGSIPLADALAGFMWITILFAGLVAFARTFEVERDEGAIDALLLVPLDRSGLFLSKALTNLSFVIVVEIVVLPLFALLFGIDLGGRWAGLILVTALANVGFVSIGTLFAALAAQTRSRDLILPILALPALVPVFIAAVELTSTLFSGGGISEVAARGWFGILVAFDVIFATTGALAFEAVLD